jgi:hypothetical protein
MAVRGLKGFGGSVPPPPERSVFSGIAPHKIRSLLRGIPPFNSTKS